MLLRQSPARHCEEPFCGDEAISRGRIHDMTALDGVVHNAIDSRLR
jgi:hypothetical protein